MLVWMIWLIFGSNGGKSPKPPKVCTVVIQGMPRAALRSHPLRVGTRTVFVREPRFELDAPSEQTTVTITGPRYRGEVVVEGHLCDVPVVLRAQPRRIRLQFGCPPRDLAVSCLNCPNPPGSGPYLPTRFPALPYHAIRPPIRLRLKAPGHRKAVREVWPLPGPNVVDTTLVPLSQ